jgi:N-acetyl-anhydromuramyl-L-alanine amidase AmpD
MRGWVFPFMAIAALVAGGACASAPLYGTRTEKAPVLAADPTARPDAATTAPRVASAARAAPAVRFPYEPQPEWLPTPTNYWYGRGHDGAVRVIVIHYTVISYARTIRAFNTRASDVSAHYVIRGDGHIAQMVGEDSTAWHSGNYWYNLNSVGIELELNETTNPVFRAEQYYAGAALACAIARRHGLPLDRAHVIGHNEVPGTDHTDPGPTWNWPHFMWLVSLCAPPTAATVRASFVSQSPYPEIAAAETATVSVVLRNTGSTAWRKGTSQEARLGIPDNRRELGFLGKDWPAPERPAVQTEEIVPPGGTATFTFAVQGTQPGKFVIPLRGVIDGGAWMNELGMYTVVTVR